MEWTSGQCSLNFGYRRNGMAGLSKAIWNKKKFNAVLLFYSLKNVFLTIVLVQGMTEIPLKSIEMESFLDMFNICTCPAPCCKRLPTAETNPILFGSLPLMPTSLFQCDSSRVHYWSAVLSFGAWGLFWWRDDSGEARLILGRRLKKITESSAH